MSKSRGPSAVPNRKLTQQQRIQQQREERQKLEMQQRRKQQIRKYSFWGGGALIVLAIAVGIVHAAQSSAPSGPISGVVTYSNLARTHVSGPVKYAQNPPVGGAHADVWLNCGIYDAPVTNENAVHSMEHGAVWITYLPSLSSADVSTLRNLVSGHSYVILSPYPGLPAKVVASAWGVQLKVSSVSDPRIAQFISKYEQGPQTPEQGGECTGGVGTPIN